MNRTACVPATIVFAAALLATQAGAVSQKPVLEPIRAQPRWPSQAVSLRGKRIPFDQVLKTLSSATGLRFSAVQHLRDRRVTVLWENRPAAQVMADLVALWSTERHPAVWKKQERAEPGYQLWQDKAVTRELERVRKADLQVMARSLQRLSSLADRAERPEPTGDPLVDFFLRTDNQWAYGGRPLGVILSSLNGPLKEAILSGGTVSAPLGQWPPQAQSTLLEQFRKISPGSTLHDGTGNAVVAVDLKLNVDSGKWDLGTTVPRKRGSFRWGQPFGDLGLSQPQRSGLFSDGDLPDDRKGTSPPQRSPGILELADLQLHVGMIWKLPVTSDYYHYKAVSVSPSALSAVPDLLQATALKMHYRCEVRPDRLLWSNTRRYFDDLNEVPATIEAKWAAVRDRGDYFEWEELAEMAHMSDRQLLTVSSRFPVVERIASPRPLLGWAGLLTTSERQVALQAPRGLPIVRSSARAREWIARNNPSGDLHGQRLEDLSIRLAVGERSGKHIHEIFLYGAEGNPMAQFGLLQDPAWLQIRP